MMGQHFLILKFSSFRGYMSVNLFKREFVIMDILTNHELSLMYTSLKCRININKTFSHSHPSKSSKKLLQIIYLSEYF